MTEDTDKDNKNKETNDNANDDSGESANSRFPPGCGPESFLWILFGAVCAVLGWAFTDKFGIDDLEVPVQVLNSTSGNDDSLFFVKDLTFDETHESDTVSTILTYILAGLVPIIIQSLLAWRFGPRADLGHTIVAYLVAFGTSLLASEPVKWYVAYRRPNFYEVCHPNESFDTCEMVDDEDPREAIFSFPSGHSSTAFTGTTLFALYIHNRFGVPAYRRLCSKTAQKQDVNAEGEGETRTAPLPGIARYRFISMVGFIVPMALAVFISVSRIVDQRHFPSDVIAGALIGVASGGWVHPLWYFYDDYDLV